MPDATFDGPNLLITLPALGAYDVETELYSAWKEWFKASDNAKYLPAFDTTGGDPVSTGVEIAPYFFCRNDLGWRIKMPDLNGEITLNGNLFPRDGATVLFESAVGFDAFLRQVVSNRAVSVAGGGGGGGDFTAPEKAALIANTSMIPFSAFLPSNSDIVGN